MADQATVSRNTSGNGIPVDAPGASMVSNVAEFGNNIATLAELQARLTLIDLKEVAGKAWIWAVLASASLLLLAGAVPVALIGLAFAFDTELRHAAAPLLITAAITAVIALAVGAVSGLRVVRSFETFRRSSEELTRNIAWIKTVLLHSGRAAPHGRR
jgi:hypothetical protein